MTSARLGLQAVFVLVLIALVSWPEQRQLRAIGFWHTHGPFSARSNDAKDGQRVGFRGQRALIGYGSARDAFGGSNPLNRKLYENDIEGHRRALPAGVIALGGRINAIVGYARSAQNAPIPFARLRLRNIATGAVEARGIADEKGRFTFVDIIPSGYIVELVDQNGIVIATSAVVEIATNDLKETTVRTSGQHGLAMLFGGALVPTASEAVAVAAGDGVNRLAAPERCASPPCN